MRRSQDFPLARLTLKKIDDDNLLRSHAKVVARYSTINSIKDRRSSRQNRGHSIIELRKSRVEGMMIWSHGRVGWHYKTFTFKRV
jgi:hypothetical protein